jgi:hypothetical protein
MLQTKYKSKTHHFDHRKERSDTFIQDNQDHHEQKPKNTRGVTLRWSESVQLLVWWMQSIQAIREIKD